MQDIYEEILEIVKTKEDLEEFLTGESNWEYLYNLSRIRRNILEWYDFNPEGTLLEIGGECGPITGLFCERLKKVVSLVDSPIKAEINKERNKNYNNLTVVNGNIDVIDPTVRFDYITLIGSLEEASLYIDGDISDEELLKKVKSLLKPEGKIIIAVDNKYGIKYWAGARDNHTGDFFASITGGGDNKTKDYSKNGLEGLLAKTSIQSSCYYYPVPDYRLPMEIYSGDRLPGAGDIAESSPVYDSNRYEVFDEKKAVDNICEDGLFEMFANSYLIICS